MKDQNDKSTAEIFPIEIIPEKKELRSFSVESDKIKDGKWTATFTFNTNINSTWGAHVEKAKKEAIAMALLEMCETTDSNGEIDFDYWEAENFLTGAKNIKQRQISDARDLINGNNVVELKTA